MNVSNVLGGSSPALASFAAAFLLHLVALQSPAQNAQVAPQAAQIQLGGIRIQVDGEVVGEDPFGVTGSNVGLLEPAEMKTDSGSQEILAQADQFVKQGRFDLASILWQRVIDESGDQVFTRDEWVERTLQNEYKKFRSVAGDIESTLAKLPPEGLSAYRLKADGEARALMNSIGERDRESALAEIVRRFFLSKLGDDAAFELACLKLDRGEFLPAARLLAKVANEYPDPSVRLGEIQLRLAAVNARVGDLALAREMLGKLKSQPIPPVPVAVIRLVENDIEAVATRRVSASDNVGSWTMPQGGPTRSGLMLAPAVDAAAGLIQGWRQEYKLTLPQGEEWQAIAAAQEAAEEAGEKMETELLDDPFGPRMQLRGNNQPSQPPSTPADIVKKWREHGWLPVGQVLMDGGKIYFKTNDRIVCCDAATGELNWFGYRSAYPQDPAAAISSSLRNYYGRIPLEDNTPSGDREVASFSDMLNQSMSIVGDRLLVVQGKALDFYEDGDLDEAGIDQDPDVQRIQRFPGGQQEMSQGRARENRLFAYHAKNGKLLWMLKPADMMPESKRPMAFAGSPVPYGSLVVVPVYEATSLWLFGLDPEQGKVLWKSFLADEAAGQTEANSPVRVAIDGGEAYVATGAGIVASVDAISGTLNWAVAYPRTTQAKADANAARNNLARFGMAPTADLDGWKDDSIIPSGNAVVVAASDFNQLVAFDRRTGDLLWESAKRPIEGDSESQYPLGIAEGRVFVAGLNVVRAYQLGGGRMLWEARLPEGGHGRGMLTKSGIFMPLTDSIVHLSLEDGNVIDTFKVDSGDDEQPLGNLFTDGLRIFSAGFRQLSALRTRGEGEVLPEKKLDETPAAPVGVTDEKEGVKEEVKAAVEKVDGVDTRESLAAEGRALFAQVYGQLESVKDAKGVGEAGEKFASTGEKFVDLARRMEALGEPAAAEAAAFNEAFATVREASDLKFSDAIAHIIEIEDTAGSFLEKVVGMQKTLEGLPILKAYGIDSKRD